MAALTERLVRKDAPVAFTVAFGRIKAMAALLDRVPHRVGGHSSGRPSWRMAAGHPTTVPCEPDCPACAWARLKGSSE